MFKTLLFDLDGTLLDCDMRIFIPKYIEVLSHHFSYLIEPEKFSEHLRQSTRAMVLNKEPHLTNEEVFMDHFLENSGLSRDEILPQLSDFYHNTFGELKAYSRKIPLARDIIQETVSKKIEVVIATNPVFPRTAIMHRLRWADVANFTYRLITSYEIMHYCKPHPEYYGEILHVLGANPDDCLMIGNDTRDDLAAGRAGIKTFLVDNFLIDRGEDSPQADYAGSLDDLLQFIQKLERQ